MEQSPNNARMRKLPGKLKGELKLRRNLAEAYCQLLKKMPKRDCLRRRYEGTILLEHHPGSLTQRCTLSDANEGEPLERSCSEARLKSADLFQNPCWCTVRWVKTKSGTMFKHICFLGRFGTIRNAIKRHSFFAKRIGAKVTGSA